ncbi:MAG TPA: LPS export ABC transporter periplasmic protein LptC, partial [Cyanobacteria bacterium UBA11368]|nr:LPS export ABC transporter periplasmic protein LptC [Cyanobacteria bacterium UBA11368]
MSRVTTLKFLLMLMLLGVGACSSEGRTQKKLAQDTAAIQSSETNLTFNNVTLEQTDAQGRPLWKVKTQQAIYSKDKKIAQVQNPFGDLFQDGKLVYQITAQQGEVYEEGNKIILRGQIVAVDTQNKAVLRGNEMEWRPKEDVLIVRDRVNGTHKQMQVAAQEARSFSRAKRMELVGQVVAIAKEPPLHLKGEYLVWQMEQEKVTSDRFIQIDRYD